MARPGKREELAKIISPLARDVLEYLESRGVTLDIDDTIAFLSRFKNKAAELTATAATDAAQPQEVKNGTP